MCARPAYDAVVVRFGPEIGVKSRPVRLRYERLITKHVRKALRRREIPYGSIEYEFGRLFVFTSRPVEAAEAISRVFGVSSTSPAMSTAPELSAIVSAGLELAKAILRRGASFAIRCRRAAEQPYTSLDVCRALGETILSELGHLDLKVNLEKPDKTIFVEVRKDRAYVFSDTCEGVGGYPIGVQGKVLCLLSGGIDSPVACWLAMKRGCLPLLVHFDIRPFTDDRLVEKAVELARVLADWSLGAIKHLYVVPYGHVLTEVKEKCPEELTCVICKRLMLRIAERMAKARGAHGIVLGDALGEQASQTLRNIRAIDSALAELPALRPLLCFDKDETVRLARRIGTYDISSRPDGGCSAAPDRPTTAASLEAVEEAEKEIDVRALIERTLPMARKHVI